MPGSNSAPAQDVTCVENVGSRCNVKALFSPRNKVVRARSLVEKILSGDHCAARNEASVKDETRYVNSNAACIYVLALFCGKEYAGKTG